MNSSLFQQPNGSEDHARPDGRARMRVDRGDLGRWISRRKTARRGGARLVLLCRNAEKAARVKDELERQHPISVRILQADFSDLAQVRKTAVTVLEEYPGRCAD